MALKLKLIGFERIQRNLEPKRFKQRLEQNVRVATRKNGLLAERKAKRDISGKKVEPSTLSTLTEQMKGSTKALVDTGELRKSIVSELESWHTVVIGVLRRRTVLDDNGNPQDIMDIAIAQHFGADIPVSDKMRKFFYWLANSKDSPLKGKIKPLKQTTISIHIPARPFLKGILARSMRKLYNKNWQQAINKTLVGK